MSHRRLLLCVGVLAGCSLPSESESYRAKYCAQFCNPAVEGADCSSCEKPEGTTYYPPAFPVIDATESAPVGSRAMGTAPVYPALPPVDGVVLGPNHADSTPIFPVATAQDSAPAGPLTSQLSEPVWPIRAPTESSQGSVYAAPSWPSVPPIQTDTGSACGGVGSTHVLSSCSIRPDSAPLTTALWTAQAIPAGTFIAGPSHSVTESGIVTVTMTASAGDPDLYVKVVGYAPLSVTRSIPSNQANAELKTSGSTVQPTVLSWTGLNGTPDNTVISVSNWHCKPTVPGSGTESCIFYLPRACELSWGVKAGVSASTVSVSVTMQTRTVSGSAGTSSGAGGFLESAAFPPGSTIVTTISWPTFLSDDYDLFAKINGTASQTVWDCKPFEGGKDGETCILSSSSPSTTDTFSIYAQHVSSGGATSLSRNILIFEADGACPSSAVLDPATNRCCACATGETANASCPTNQCGTSCTGSNVVCGAGRCCSLSCAAGYSLVSGVCVPTKTSCAGSDCGAGTCQMVSGTPMCLMGCSGGSSHVCQANSSQCCDWTCPADYTPVKNGTSWECKPLNQTCTPTATAACAAASRVCVVNGGMAACQAAGSCPALYPTLTLAHPCAADSSKCCGFQCGSADYRITGSVAAPTCTPVTDFCTPTAIQACNGSCAVANGASVCRAPRDCAALYPAGAHACSSQTNQCCAWSCSNSDYRLSANSPWVCNPVTSTCTPTAISACAAESATCGVKSGAATCSPGVCSVLYSGTQGAHPCLFDPAQCCGFDCPTGSSKSASGLGKCEKHDCSIPEVCRSGDRCLSEGAFASPAEQCEHRP
jgi:hypothetical protein